MSALLKVLLSSRKEAGHCRATVPVLRQAWSDRRGFRLSQRPIRGIPSLLGLGVGGISCCSSGVKTLRPIPRPVASARAISCRERAVSISVRPNSPSKAGFPLKMTTPATAGGSMGASWTSLRRPWTSIVGPWTSLPGPWTTPQTRWTSLLRPWTSPRHSGTLPIGPWTSLLRSWTALPGPWMSLLASGTTPGTSWTAPESPWTAMRPRWTTLQLPWMPVVVLWSAPPLPWRTRRVARRTPRDRWITPKGSTTPLSSRLLVSKSLPPLLR